MIGVISFTERGMRLSMRLLENWEKIQKNAGNIMRLYTMHASTSDGGKLENIRQAGGSVTSWAAERMRDGDAMLFIGACGIAVRAVAPGLKDKYRDPPVLVMDEMGYHVIPILSGHMGGANDLAVAIAGAAGAIPVITTATDLEGKFAADLFAKKNGLAILEREGVAMVSAKALSGTEIAISVETGHIVESAALPENVRLIPYPPDGPVDILVSAESGYPALLHLIPREYAVGCGVRRGKGAGELDVFLRKALESAGLEPWQVFALASIDKKRCEPCLLSWSAKNRIPFLTYTAEELRGAEGAFHASDFVSNAAGVDNVCERAAALACGPGYELVYEKHAQDGMTAAIARRNWSVSFDEE